MPKYFCYLYDPELLLLPERGDDVPERAAVRHVDLEDGAGEALLGPHADTHPLSLHLVYVQLPANEVMP